MKQFLPKAALCGCALLLTTSTAFCQETTDLPTLDQVKEGSWKYLGEGSYFCDLVGENFTGSIYTYRSNPFPNTQQAYLVPVYESEDYPGWYRFAPFAGELFNGAYTSDVNAMTSAFQISSDDLIYINATDPDKVYYAYSGVSFHVKLTKSGVVISEVDIAGPCVIESIVPENGITGSSWKSYYSYGTLSDNVISFPNVTTSPNGASKLGGITLYNTNATERNEFFASSLQSYITFSSRNYIEENSINANRRGKERLELPTNIPSGISGMEASGDREPYYMDLNGMRIAGPAKGISLRVNPDGSVSKIVR